MEEVQRYECIYGKFSKDFKNKYIRLNSWKAIGEKFGLDAPKAERRYKNCRGDVVLDEANVDEQERRSELAVEDVANSDMDSRASTTNTSSSTSGNSH